MPCPVCNQERHATYHRSCVFELLKSGQIKSVSEWEKLAEIPKTIFIRKVVRKVRKQEE